MKSKILFLFGVVCFLCFQALAQPEIKFENELHDFGKIEEGEKATHVFTFTNVGTAPLILSNVKASCGCTTPSWPKEPIMPGKTGEVKAVYNSKGRPGAFTKTITVTSNAETTTKMVRIKGVVEKKPPTAEELAASPILDVDKKVIKLGKIERGKRVSLKLNVKNKGKNKLLINKARSKSNNVALNYKTREYVEPGKSSTLELFYTPRNVGEVNDEITLESNDLKTPEYKVKVQATVVESLGPQKSMLKEN